MDAILAIPMPVRLLVLYALGVVTAAFLNLAVYRLAWQPRSISAWSAPLTEAPLRRWSDRVPILGWLGLARESSLHGRGFWLRPLILELLTGAAFAGLYVWQMDAVPNWRIGNGLETPRPEFLSDNLSLVLHARYLAHVILISLMLVASLIDFDEKTIPDSITVPGTCLGLLLATIYPWSLLPAGDWIIGPKRAVEFLTLVSPSPWPAELDGLPHVEVLAIALGCWTLWCGGLMPRRWNTRRGLVTATRVFLHRLRVERITYAIALLWAVGAVAISLVAWQGTAASWAALVTALVGMAVGGAVVWIVRVVGTTVLRREAMGFGDVTLLSMIGAFLGWQAALAIFFIAPFFGLAIGLLQWVAQGDNEIPYGPYLCLAAVAVILRWTEIWNWGQPLLALGWLLPGVLAICMVMMGGMLLVYRLLRDMIAGSRISSR